MNAHSKGNQEENGNDRLHLSNKKDKDIILDALFAEFVYFDFENQNASNSYNFNSKWGKHPNYRLFIYQH